MTRIAPSQVFRAILVLLASACGGGTRPGASAHSRPDAPGLVVTAQVVRELGAPTPCPRASLRLDDGRAAYYACQLREPAQAAPEQAVPRYPGILRSADVEGDVTARFVIDSAGRVRAGSLRIVASTHELLLQAVRASLPNMHWRPARRRGRTVAQVAERTFRFRLVADSAESCPAVDAPERESLVCGVVEYTAVRCSHEPCPQPLRRRRPPEPRPAPPVVPSLPNVTLQLTAPREHHGYPGSASVPASAASRAFGVERRS